jgi:hypothetical protein
VITKRGSKKLEMEVEHLHDEVVTLKTAIEEAILEGQKSMDDLNDIPKSGLISKTTLPSPA